ncbi:MAG: hypothetical protein GY950_37645 [bacterium]|nr:hypothetical protein [bacterium]
MKKVIFLFFILALLVTLGLNSEEKKSEEKKRVENTVEVKKFGGYWYAYMDFNGNYSLIGKRQKKFVKNFKKQGLKQTGPFFITFYNPPSVYSGKDLKWALCYPIDKDTEVKKPLGKKFIEPIKSVIILHTKPREKIWDSFNAVQDYIKEKKFEKAWPAYEIYHRDNGIEVIHPVKE